MTDTSSVRLNIDEPRWDQNTFMGRMKHFMSITDMRTVLCSTSELENAKKLVNSYRLGQEPLGTTEEQLWRAKQLYESSFHPDSGELQNVIGRMSFQVPGGMAITGCMMQFYRTNTAVIFWQWINQSFNALVNYTNRNAESDMTPKRIAIAYVTATTSAVLTAIGLKNVLAKRASPLMQRFVPFAAVAAANCVNIPLMRQSEIEDGIMCADENRNKAVQSQVAAAKGITLVLASRIFMAAPGMLLCPIMMERLEKTRWMQRIKLLHAPIQVMMVGCILVVMVPTACSLFPQWNSISTETLKKWEPKKYSDLQDKYHDNMPSTIYFNKGL
ncbi:PREDICTED: sideroflexin-2-like [Priapulus caudatus]|uniref:Sidoreflexin n=1 Tax=Priapulus caudatus TaxID=37621 RepID=A0ABM1EL76_PRICU|nr:PREDICTED: sideroflexin-2-like [Priapulus caudatus]XP_014672940.1 PREDICTED: sideroflexin-2-like [Priapulus caudatus]XP_014672947.1 PREDICTED: sideroflexin-2-like [Priapulus caudatus]